MKIILSLFFTVLHAAVSARLRLVLCIKHSFLLILAQIILQNADFVHTVFAAA
jgi:hypothetical protein